MSTHRKSAKVDRAWLQQHVSDPYVQRAQRDGYRSRAAYKLEEIDRTLGLVRPGQCVVDLGSTPGAWSQYLRRKLMSGSNKGGGAAIYALDLLPMEPIADVCFIEGDIREAATLEQLDQALAGRSVDLVVSDMAPNLSGIASADAARVQDLVEMALDFAGSHLQPRGALLAKVFHGGAYDELVRRFRTTFAEVKVCKPKASRDKSTEVYLCGRGLRLPTAEMRQSSTQQA